MIAPSFEPHEDAAVTVSFAIISLQGGYTMIEITCEVFSIAGAGQKSSWTLITNVYILGRNPPEQALII